jgi:23S rRNA (guanosine2251-2'-O)-methyltransferase
MSEIITGRNPVLEALKAGRPINRILLERNISRHSTIAEILSLAARQHIPVEYVESRAVNRVIPEGSQGVIAYTAAKEYVTVEDLLQIAREKNEPPFLLILDGIEDPQNLGAILRTAEAAGVHGVIIRTRREVGLTDGVSRASAGAIEYVPVARVTNLAQIIQELKDQSSKLKTKTKKPNIENPTIQPSTFNLQTGDIWVTGVDMSGKTDFRRVDYTSGTAIVIGGEGQGLSELVRKRCDNVVRIPMKGKIASLNASVAAALAIYEVFRQRETGQDNRVRKSE